MHGVKDINAISSEDYGFGLLENKLISVLKGSDPPDFEAAEQFILSGADINAEGKQENENLLSRILDSYRYLDENPVEQKRFGVYIQQIICFFIRHGFDFKLNNGLYGTQCLYSLVFFSSPKTALDAAKLLIKAGAKDSRNKEMRIEEGKVLSSLSTENSYQRVCEYNYEAANNLEALYQIIKAAEYKQPYDGINSFETVVGKTITKVLIENPQKCKALHDVIMTNGHFAKSFYSNLMFLFDDQRLIATPYVDFWTDKNDSSIPTNDVSNAFSAIIGATVDSISFGHNCVYRKMSCHTQPVASFTMSNGQTLTFTTGFGEVDNNTCSAYFYFGQPIVRKDGEPGIEMWWDHGKTVK